MIKEQISTFDVINEIVSLKKMQVDQTIRREGEERLADLEEYSKEHMINHNLFGVFDRVHNEGTLLPYFTDIDIENMVVLVNQLCYSYFNKFLIHQELREVAVAIIVENAELHGVSFAIEKSIVSLCANQLVSEAIRLSDYYTLKEEKE